MKIVSKFKDYYDRVLAHGQDDRIPYVRLEEEIPLENFSPSSSGAGFELRRVNKPKAQPEIDYVSFSSGRIWLCGKTYRYLRASIRDIAHTYRYLPSGGLNVESRVSYFYTIEQLEKFVESLGFLVKDICEDKLFGYRGNYASPAAFLSAQGTTEAYGQMVEKRLVLIRRGRDESYQEGGRYGMRSYWDHNFPLKEVEFYKLMDPYQVYQELDMYVCGVLGQQAKEVITISDKDRIYQHGFDKYSFRKPPEEGKRKK